MSLTAADVAEIMRLVEQSTFDELTLEMDGVKLSLRRGAAADEWLAVGDAAFADAASSGGVPGRSTGARPGGSLGSSVRQLAAAIPR